MVNKLYKNLLLFVTGGGIYVTIEIIWRAIMHSTPTHWAMFLIGGLLFLILGGLNEWIPWEVPLVRQCLIGAIVIVVVEFVSGCILNLWLGLAIWDYSDKALNIMGQVCPQFAIAWFFLAGAAIILDDYLRYWLFGEEKPHYVLVAVQEPPKKKRKKKREKIEFSKILVSWALVFTTICVAISYLLSMFDHDPAQEVTVAVASACIAIGVAYQAKSFGEKNSRNKYGVDKYGRKMDDDDDGDSGAVG